MSDNNREKRELDCPLEVPNGFLVERLLEHDRTLAEVKEAVSWLKDKVDKLDMRLYWIIWGIVGSILVPILLKVVSVWIGL